MKNPSVKPETLKRFQLLQKRRKPVDEPQGVSPLEFVKIVNSLADGAIHGTVIRRLRHERTK